MKRRAIRLVAAGVAIALTFLVIFASVDHCGTWDPVQPQLLGVLRGHGPLLVGAARADFALPLPIRRGGYPWPWHNVQTLAKPLQARALVFTAGGQSVALVSLDVLLIPSDLSTRISDGQDLPVMTVATHTHSGPGQFDSRLVPEVAALGLENDATRDAIVKAAREAISWAKAHQVPATLKVNERNVPEFAHPRSGDAVDTLMTRLQFASERGVMAELFLVAAHPTFVPREAAEVNGDYPAAVDNDEKILRVVVQSSAGNARGSMTTIEEQAAMVKSVFDGNHDGETETFSEIDIGHASVRVGLPVPDASRAGPALVQPMVKNALCRGAEHTMLISTLRLGPVSLLAVPVEPSWGAGQVLLEQTRVTRIASMVDGYEGYVEPEGVLRELGGESKRQFFGPDFLKVILEGARLSASAAGIAVPQ